MPYRPMELNVLPAYLAYKVITKGCSLLLCLAQMRCHRPVEQKCMEQTSSAFGGNFLK